MNIDLMEYNTTRNHLVMREYGRHIQKMIEYVLTIEDEERRQRNAHALIELMGFLNPHLKNVEDFRHKLWDHLFLISDFKLNVKLTIINFVALIIIFINCFHNSRNQVNYF